MSGDRGKAAGGGLTLLVRLYPINSVRRTDGRPSSSPHSSQTLTEGRNRVKARDVQSRWPH